MKFESGANAKGKRVRASVLSNVSKSNSDMRCGRKLFRKVDIPKVLCVKLFRHSSRADGNVPGDPVDTTRRTWDSSCQCSAYRFCAPCELLNITKMFTRLFTLTLRICNTTPSDVSLSGISLAYKHDARTGPRKRGFLPLLTPRSVCVINPRATC